MRDQFRDDLAIFSNPDEFGASAVITTSSGAITVTGIPDAIADTERPGANTNSGRSAFVAAAADINVSKLQFYCAFHQLTGVKPEDALTIADGDYAGSYRIRQVLRDGDMAMIRMNTA